MNETMLIQVLPQWVGWVFCGIGLFATVTDYFTGRIYNWLTFPAILLGLVITGLEGSTVFWASALGLLVASLFFLPLFFFGILGGGDVKLAMAYGTVLGVSGVFEFTFACFLVGGVASFALLVLHKRVKYFCSQMWLFLKSILVKQLEVQWPKLSKTSKAPFGIAILAGYLWVWLSVTTLKGGF